MTSSWFKYSKWPLIGRVNTPSKYAFSRIIFNFSKRNNRSTHTQLVSGTTRLHKTDKHDFKRWIDYCGIFYFFIKYLKIKQQHYEHDIKPVFTKWAKLTIQPLSYHDFSATLESLVIPIVDTIHAMDHDDMAASHLEGYKEYELLLLITYCVRKYNTSLLDFTKETTVHIQSDVAALVPIISLYDIQRPQASNYYFLSNIFHYLWDKFWEKKPEARLEIVENGERFELMQIPGRRSISLADNRTQLQKLKEYIDQITGEIVYTLLSFEVERDHICGLVTDFSSRLYLIERDIRWHQGLKGRCGWERNFWRR